MKTELMDNGKLSSILTVVLEPSDYKSRFNQELKKYKDKAHMKGFRKGKTPLSAIRKMYGKNVLAEVVYDELNKSIENFIVEEKLDILGNPLPADGQAPVHFDYKNFETYEFKFEIGHAPQFDVKGVNEDSTYSSYKVHLSDDDIKDELSQLQKRLGEQEEVDSAIEELDILTLKITENNSEREEPYQTEITIMPDRMVEKYRSEFIGKSKGYATTVNIYQLELDSSEDYVKKYFLKDAPEDCAEEFDAEVSSIKRLKPAELNEEFYKKAFGTEDITSENEAIGKLREDLNSFYESQSTSITKRKILEQLIETNNVDMPDEFLKKWLLASNKELTEEQLETEYEPFIKNLRWTLIKNSLSKKYDIKISPEDIRAAMIEKVKAQFAQYGYGVMGDFDYDGMADRMMQNQESVQKEYEELLAEEVLDKIIENVSLDEKAINTEEYKEIVTTLRQNNAS